MNKGSKRQIRVLHVVGGMNRGGAETWLMHVLRHIDRDRFRFDFLVHTDKPCAYDDEIRDLGSKIIPCLVPSQPWRYAVKFARIMREYGPYDVVHSHVHHYSGFVLWLAKRSGVRTRIAHSHNENKPDDANPNLYRRIYLSTMVCFLRFNATIGLAASNKAAQALYGQDWKNDPRWHVLYCAVDLAPFFEENDKMAIRKELGIPENAFVVGHVGRFSEQKNHAFLLDVIRCMVERDPDVRCLLVGDGPLRQDIENKIIRLGLTKHVIFTGVRADVPRLMLGAMDVFLLPSHYEGLGLVLIEAQAAGLPCVFSDVIPSEADVVPTLVKRVSLAQPPEKWAEMVVMTKDTISVPRAQAMGLIWRSPFEINQSIEKLTYLYSA